MRASFAALTTVVALILFLTLRGGAQSLQDIPEASDTTHSPVVAELFTSQSCSSCPPAERFFSELADRDDLIVLEWHVDYWDRLIHGRAGAWEDPYSDAAYTKRQRDYNRALRGTSAVYTPQAIINGVAETVASQRDTVTEFLTPAVHATAAVSVVSNGDDRQITVADYVRPLQRDADIIQLTLLPDQTTSVPRGENRGAILSSKNIVLAARRVGTYDGTATALELDTLDTQYRCAIIIQETRGAQLGPIIGASYCD